MRFPGSVTNPSLNIPGVEDLSAYSRGSPTCSASFSMTASQGPPEGSDASRSLSQLPPLPALLTSDPRGSESILRY